MREFKKMVYLKELACTRLLEDRKPLEPAEPDYYDSISRAASMSHIDFDTPLYSDPKKLIDDIDSLSYDNELFEVLLFNSQEYAPIDFDYIMKLPRRQGPSPFSDARLAELFGTPKEYYTEMANAFYMAQWGPAIWQSRTELNTKLSWLNVHDRRYKKNVWAEVKNLLRSLSLDDKITNKAEHHYDKITLGQLLLFISLYRIRHRVVNRGLSYRARAHILR